MGIKVVSIATILGQEVWALENREMFSVCWLWLEVSRFLITGVLVSVDYCAGVVGEGRVQGRQDLGGHHQVKNITIVQSPATL